MATLLFCSVWMRVYLNFSYILVLRRNCHQTRKSNMQGRNHSANFIITRPLFDSIPDYVYLLFSYVLFRRLGLRVHGKSRNGTGRNHSFRPRSDLVPGVQVGTGSPLNYTHFSGLFHLPRPSWHFYLSCLVILSTGSKYCRNYGGKTHPEPILGTRGQTTWRPYCFVVKGERLVFPLIWLVLVTYTTALKILS